ncbi:MAG: MFS transporter, partial [Pseudomonadota bacterium]|nr:MFS transporter [Pseudomonadota bacterium]
MNARQRKLIASLSASKLADLLISAKTTLPALLLAAGAPAWMLGWLVPIRESGALLPQAPLGVLLRRLPARHRVWRVGMHVQILSVLGIAAAALFLEGATAGWCMLAALVLLSLGRSACSLSMKDIQADIVEQGERGKLLGIASTISGILTLAIAVPLTFMGEDLGNKVASGITLFAAGAFTVGLVILYANHTRVETEEDGSSGFNWRFDSTVYRFILVRGLFVHS